MNPVDHDLILRTLMQDRKKYGAGEVILRDARERVHGKRVFSLVAVMTFPDEVKLKGEHKYPLVIYPHDGSFSSRLVIDHQGETDMTKELHGNTLGNMVTMPIWRLG